MRILRVVIENLASLRGVQPTIELADGALEDAGLVAITGATGAGKTTILDAVCLALYDRTPRLGGRGDDTRELLARGATEARAAVTLRLDDGRTWLAEWKVRRARNKVDGNLQPVSRRLLDLDTSTILADQKRAVDTMIHEQLGLSFEQFTGVVLLAQGEFAKFLQANDAERSELLERLTGTEIYSRLSTAAFDRHKRLAEQLRAAEERLDELEVLDDDARRALETERDALEPRLVRLDAQVRGLEERVDWLDRHVELARADTEAARALEAAGAAVDEAAPERERLQAAERAGALAAPLQAFDAARDAVNAAAQQHETASAAVAQTLERRRETAAATAGALAALETTRGDATSAVDALAAFEAATPERLQAVRDARADAQAAHRRAAERSDEAAHTAAAAQAADEALGAAMPRLEAAETADQRARRRLDELLAKRRAQVGAATAESLLKLQHLLQQAAELRQRLATLDPDASAAAHDTAARAHAATVAEAEAARALRDGARRELDDHVTLAHMAQRGVDIAEQRDLLEPGEPCPLCGSLEHPLGGHGSGREREALRGAEERSARLRREIEQHEAAVREAEALAARHSDAMARAAEALERDRRDADEALARWLELRLELGELPASPDELEPREPLRRIEEIEHQLALLKTLEDAESTLRRDAEATADARRGLQNEIDLLRQRAEQARARLDEARTAATSAAGDAARADETLHARATELAEAVALEAPAAVADGTLLDTVTAFLGTVTATRETWHRRVEIDRRLRELERRLGRPGRALLEALPGDRGERVPSTESPLDAGDPLATRAERLERHLDAVVPAAQRAERAHGLAVERASHTEAALAAAHRRREDAETALAGRLESSDFADVDALRAALLSADAVDALRRRLDDLRIRRERAEERRDAAASALTAHRSSAESLGLSDDEIDTATAVDSSTRNTWQDELHRLRARHKEATARRTELEVDLRRDDERRAERARLEDARTSLGDRCALAAKLNDLIGQRSGGKFRRFAQQLNLDRLLGLANRRLERLAPRYRLVRVASKLELEVIDQDMADERRPVATLSGGESFLVSLALALGLADLRRGSLELGTLFLDEGFGSLDQDTLDTALSTLEQLQVDQQTQILLISHVGALRERIAHRIDVRKLGGGRSKLRVVDA